MHTSSVLLAFWLWPTSFGRVPVAHSHAPVRQHSAQVAWGSSSVQNPVLNTSSHICSYIFAFAFFLVTVTDFVAFLYTISSRLVLAHAHVTVHSDSQKLSIVGISYRTHSKNSSKSRVARTVTRWLNKVYGLEIRFICCIFTSVWLAWFHTFIHSPCLMYCAPTLYAWQIDCGIAIANLTLRAWSWDCRRSAFSGGH